MPIIGSVARLNRESFAEMLGTWPMGRDPLGCGRVRSTAARQRRAVAARPAHRRRRFDRPVSSILSLAALAALSPWAGIALAQDAASFATPPNVIVDLRALDGLDSAPSDKGPPPRVTRWAGSATPMPPPSSAVLADPAPAGVAWPRADPVPGVRPTLGVVAGPEGPTRVVAEAPGAEAADDASDPFLDGDYWLGYGLRPIDLVTAPLRWETEDWIASGLVAGLGVGL